MASSAPNLKQLAVLDWLRRWPSVFLADGGDWSHAWASEAARLHCMGALADLGIPAEADERPGFGNADGTPHCGAATFKVLLSRGWIGPMEARGHLRQHYSLTPEGTAALLRFCFRLKNFKPRLALDRIRRPVQPSAKLLKRYGGPEQARRYLRFHERRVAYHQRLADRIRESLDLYDGSPEQRRDEWAARGRRLQR